MREAEVERALAQLHSTVHPNVEAVFLNLASLKLYQVGSPSLRSGKEIEQEIFVFFNKWQEGQFEKCVEGVKRVVEGFHLRMVQVDESQKSSIKRDVVTFMEVLRYSFSSGSSICSQKMDGLHSEKALEAVFEVFFGYPSDMTFLELAPLRRVEAFLIKKCPINVNSLTMQSPTHQKKMTEEGVKASEIIAKRLHLDCQFLKSGLVYIQIACRQLRENEDLSLEDRLTILLDGAQSEFLSVASPKALKYLYRITEGIEYQIEVRKGIHEAEAVFQRLKREVLSLRDLFTIITTSASFNTDVFWQEKLLDIAEKYDD